MQILENEGDTLKKIIIVGAGEIGKNLADILSREKNKVVLIEKNERTAKELAVSIDALVIHGDGTEMLTLEDAGIEKTDSVIAVTKDDKTNLMICEIAKSMNIPKVVAVVNKPGNNELFIKLGISDIIPVTETGVVAIKNAISDVGVRVLGEIGEGKAQILEIVIQQNSKAVGLKGNCINSGVIGAVYRNGSVIIADKKTTLQEGDVITVLSKTEKVPGILKLVKGD